MTAFDNAVCPVSVGDKYTWMPTAFIGGAFAADRLPSVPGSMGKLAGEVTEINHEHRWFRLTAVTNGYIYHECMKF